MLRPLRVSLMLTLVLAVTATISPSAARACQECTPVGGVWFCQYATTGGSICELPSDDSDDCNVRIPCNDGGGPAAPVRFGLIAVFTASAGSYAGFPDTATPSTSSISDTVSEIASLMGTSTANISLRAGGFIVGPQDAWSTFGDALTASKGFTFRTSVSGSDVTYNVCSYDGSTSTSVASEVLADGDLLMAHATINSVDVIITMYRGDLSGSAWESDGLDIQSDFFTDVANNVVSRIALTLAGSPPTCN